MITEELRSTLVNNLHGILHIIKVDTVTCSKCGKVNATRADMVRLPIMHSSIDYLDSIVGVNAIHKYTIKNKTVGVEVVISTNKVICKQCHNKMMKILKKTGLSL